MGVSQDGSFKIKNKQEPINTNFRATITNRIPSLQPETSDERDPQIIDDLLQMHRLSSFPISDKHQHYIDNGSMKYADIVYHMKSEFPNPCNIVDLSNASKIVERIRTT